MEGIRQSADRIYIETSDTKTHNEPNHMMIHDCIMQDLYIGNSLAFLTLSLAGGSLVLAEIYSCYVF